MDVLSGLLESPHARGAFLLRAVLDPPWSMRVQDEAPLTVVSVVRGRAWALIGSDEPVCLDAGDVAVFRGPDRYVVSDAPDTDVQVVIHPGQRCSTPDGRPLEMDLGVRTWGNAADGATMMLIGTYPMPGEISRRLLAALPPLLVLPSHARGSSLVPLLGEEIGRDEAGQDAVLDRVLDLLVIAVLREWLSRPEAEAPGWYQALGDPVVGPALRSMHDSPGRPWTVAGLASESGVSRAALARRFTELVGAPPMAYLTDLRLSTAADLLESSDATIETVARQVGYGSAFALSAAFKRERGVSPRQHRQGAAAGRTA